MAYEGWAIVELMGHRQRAGLVSEVEQYGTNLLRIDIPTTDAGTDEQAEGERVTEYYGGAALYAVRPASEEVARAIAKRLGDVRPVMPVQFRVSGPQEAAPYREPFRDEDEDDEPF